MRIYGASNIETRGKLRVGMDFVGFADSRAQTLLRVRGKLSVNGVFSLGHGCNVDIGPEGVMSVGSSSVTANSLFVVMHGLSIGDGCAISWGCQFLDDDFHHLSYAGRKESADKRIAIGNRVWIGSNVTVLKGAKIPNGSVVAAGSVVTSQFEEENTLLAGSPAKVIRRGVNWA